MRGGRPGWAAGRSAWTPRAAATRCSRNSRHRARGCASPRVAMRRRSRPRSLTSRRWCRRLSPTAVRGRSTRAAVPAHSASSGRRTARGCTSRAELTCAKESKRTVSGISLLSPDGIWMDAHQWRSAGATACACAPFPARREASHGVRARSAPARLTVDDVIEASPHVAAPALEAALVESRANVGLNARRLIELDDAGVPLSVIDLMVRALTYSAGVLGPAHVSRRSTDAVSLRDGPG